MGADSAASEKTKVLYVLPYECPDPIPSMVGVKGRRVSGFGPACAGRYGGNVCISQPSRCDDACESYPITPYVEGNENSVEVDEEVT